MPSVFEYLVPKAAAHAEREATLKDARERQAAAKEASKGDWYALKLQWSEMPDDKRRPMRDDEPDTWYDFKEPTKAEPVGVKFRFKPGSLPSISQITLGFVKDGQLVQEVPAYEISSANGLSYIGEIPEPGRPGDDDDKRRRRVSDEAREQSETVFVADALEEGQRLLQAAYVQSVEDDS